MMNIYNGTVTLDAHGRATVTMPEWFSALNRDFQYQLTAIGAPGPKLYIASEMYGNAFQIAGGEKRYARFRGWSTAFARTRGPTRTASRRKK